MYDREVAVLEGQCEVRHPFHGRMSRWQRLVAEREEMPTSAKVVGISFHTPVLSNKALMAIHNDYLRILFVSSWAGLFLHLGFYGTLLARTSSVGDAERFLIHGMMAIVLLYSVTAGARENNSAILYPSSPFRIGTACSRKGALEPSRLGSASPVPPSPRGDRGRPTPRPFQASA